MGDQSGPVLVTGGAGFSGSYIVRRLLDDGYEAVIYDLGDFRPEARFVIGDAAGRIPLERGGIETWPRLFEVVQRYRPRAIVYTASVMDIGHLNRNPMIALTVNTGGAVNVMEAARLLDVGRVILFSSIAVHGQKLYEPMDADHPTIMARVGPLGAYGAAKVAAEAFAYAYHQSFGLDTRVIRPSALYGFGMSWFAPNYVKNVVEPALLGQPVRLASGGQVPRSYIHVADLAALVAALLAGPDDADRVFYGATDGPLRTGGDVGRIVQELVPGADIEIADAMTETDRAELPFRATLSIDQARAQLGYTPRYTNLEDGIAEYIERFRAYLAAGGTPAAAPAGLNAPGSG
ncbi:MAG: NAD(P)-dependent oxidoreductase [Chloroflexota bacterium]|nr:NAD(P)-dependent oxidoreductase [Chloroflexota bacterium]